MKNLNQSLSAIALSIISSPITNQVWDFIDLFSPNIIYKKISHNRKLKVQNFLVRKYGLNPLEASQKILNKCRSKNIKIITYWDFDYPPLLKKTSYPPLVLYYYGDLKNIIPISIVGTRKADQKSLAVTKKISLDLSQLGYTIVSGMAIGIDREAQIAALNNGGRTIGVLANGIDILYPLANRDLYNYIKKSKNSVLISEYPPEIMAGKWTFARRNRIISGLSLGTIIVKAALRSGALITAKYALEQNREVFACPGHSFDNSYYGCHQLLKEGAVLVRDTEDIINELPDLEKNQIAPLKVKDSLPFNSENSPTSTLPEIFIDLNNNKNNLTDLIINKLNFGDKNIDELIRELNYSLSEIQEALILLEISGRICKNGNMVSKI